ncbi:hypothetical protein D3C87_574460 [compost metagenome]
MAPVGAVMPTLSVPSGLRVKPAGAPTSDSDTLAVAGGVTPLSASLPSTLGVLAPGAVGPKLSSAGTSRPLLMFNVAVAVPHTAPLGAGRQAW